MLVDEAVARPWESVRRIAGNWFLTILAASLLYERSCEDNEDIYFQGNYDYDAHAQVYAGGADPLGSQGYASVVKNPSSS
jgi:hypothetical protein